jgi:hypothetical protein
MKKTETQKETEKLEKKFEAFEENIKELTVDNMNRAPIQDVEPQTKLSQKELEKSKEVYLKPIRAISSKEKFNEKFMTEYTFAKEYVRFICENREIIGEKIDLWTKPFPGMPAEEWMVPVNTPVWGPRYLAEQLRRKYYHRLIMEDKPVSSDGEVTYYGQMTANKTIPRITCEPVNERKSIFMGAGAF